ncbi:MAG: DUF4923 family protein [Muribaculaceae bacterium]|nr:DUF4923 family protein [Muribaculaceae bacterium]
MKKYFLMIGAVLGFLSLGSCGTGLQGLGTSSSTQSSSGLGNVLGSLGGLSGIGDILSSVLGANSTDIVGTWTYDGPAVMFESQNVLTQIGGQVAANTISNKLDGYLQKVGITKGAMTMTFDRNGNFVQTLGSRSQGGTYVVNNGNVELTYKSGTKQFVGTTQLSGNNLVVVMDATKLLNFAKNIAQSSGNSTLNSISSIASGVTGMEVGFKFVKN